MDNKHPTTTGRPVSSFAMEFEWHTGHLEKLFDLQIELIRNALLDALVEDRAIIYLSCPISSRGGGYHVTNVDIARYTERRIVKDWGDRFWVLNPAMYQMESKEGRGMMRRHAKTLGLSDEQVAGLPRASGGDYLRMWTKVLVEDVDPGSNGHVHLGRRFDAFYFIGPSDVHHYFTDGGTGNISAGIETYFARKYAMDPDFRDHFSVPGIEWKPGWETDPRLPATTKSEQRELRRKWEDLRKNFFRFYGVRASVNFSLGSHDEWNIFQKINDLRLTHTSEILGQINDPGDLLSGYFDGRQIDPGAAVARVSRGYEPERV